MTKGRNLKETMIALLLIQQFLIPYLARSFLLTSEVSTSSFENTLYFGNVIFVSCKKRYPRRGDIANNKQTRLNSRTTRTEIQRGTGENGTLYVCRKRWNSAKKIARYNIDIVSHNK